MYCDQSGEDADQEQYQHHVLCKPNVLLLHAGTVSVAEEVIHGVKVPASESTPCPRLIETLEVVLVDVVEVNTELMLLWHL